MKYFFKITYIFLLSLTAFLDLSLKNPISFAEQLNEINLEEEIKEGNLLIGLKQYLGKSNINEDALIVKTNNKFLRVESSNGLQHQSRQIKIVFKKMPLEKPYILEKLVSQPLASFESAKKQADLLAKQGLKPKITMPKNWEI